MISIITSFYKNKKLLEECMESVSKQTFKDFEHIIVDDGSTEDISKIISKYQNIYDVKYIRKRNGGPSTARNTGIVNSMYDYVVTLDYDDILLPTYLERCLEVITSQSADVCYTHSIDFNQAGIIKTRKSFSDVGSNLLVENGITSCSMIRKSKLIKVGMYDEHCPGCEDYLLWCELYLSGAKFSLVDEYLLKYRVSPDSRFHSRTFSEFMKIEKYFRAKLKLSHEVTRKRYINIVNIFKDIGN